MHYSKAERDGSTAIDEIYNWFALRTNTRPINTLASSTCILFVNVGCERVTHTRADKLLVIYSWYLCDNVPAIQWVKPGSL